MNTLMIRQFKGLQPYEPIWQAMRHFTDQRAPTTSDELWLLEHPPVFTQGQAGKPEHLLNPHHIPVIQTDRGGQITYHGPGQLIVYTLFDINRLGIGTRQLVRSIEQVIIAYLNTLNITAITRAEAPGIYIKETGAKICSIGLRVRRGCSYHGIAFNVNMDLKPFSYINPCGHRGMLMTQVCEWAPKVTIEHLRVKIISNFLEQFGYNHSAMLEHDCLEPAHESTL